MISKNFILRGIIPFLSFFLFSRNLTFKFIPNLYDSKPVRMSTCTRDDRLSRSSEGRYRIVRGDYRLETEDRVLNCALSTSWTGINSIRDVIKCFLAASPYISVRPKHEEKSWPGQVDNRMKRNSLSLSLSAALWWRGGSVSISSANLSFSIFTWFRTQ